MTKGIEKWWDEISQHYQKDLRISTKSAHYGLYAPDEDELKLLGNVKGKHILEIGCGGGQCSIAFAKQGAKCIGIDISKEQLKYAENLAKKNKVRIKFIHGTFQNLKVIDVKSQDIVFSAFALQYSPNLKKVFQEVHRVLKEKGIFVFSLDHPFYFMINPKTHKIERSYFKTGKFEEIEVWPDGSKHKEVIYRRKISDIANALIESGFYLEKIIEPFSPQEHPVWKKIFPLKLAKLIGPTIIFKSRKKR